MDEAKIKRRLQRITVLFMNMILIEFLAKASTRVKGIGCSER
jgi:hypothetical protein